MVILGLADGFRAAAALVIDDALTGCETQERHDRTLGSAAFPWAATEEVLEDAGLRNRHVDLVAVAGRFSPPFFVRRHPGVRRLARDPFSPALDAEVFYEAMLRQSGIGALEEDRVADWLHRQLGARGYAQQRVVMVDIHAALAAAAYRTQPDDDVLVLTLHPLGDGVSCAVHHGHLGQLERVWAQRGFGSLHLHLQRVCAAIGLDPLADEPILSGLAGRGEPDEELVELLAREVHAEGPRLSRHAYPRPVSREEPLYRALAAADPEVAAASVLYNLRKVVKALVRHHVARTGVRRVALGGAIFAEPRLVAAVAELEEVEAVTVAPEPGWPSLALGAAVWLAGVAPHRVPATGLGRQYSERQYTRAFSVAHLRPEKPVDLPAGVAAVLEKGGAVARFVGRGGFGRIGGGTRSVLVRADDPAAVERVRTRLGRHAREEPGCLWLDVPRDGRVRDLERLEGPLRFGNAAVQVDAAFAERYPGVVAADGRVLLTRVAQEDDPSLHATLRLLHARTGCAALAAFPLAEGREPPVAVPGDALRTWRRAALAALWCGPFLLGEPS